MHYLIGAFLHAGIRDATDLLRSMASLPEHQADPSPDAVLCATGDARPERSLGNPFGQWQARHDDLRERFPREWPSTFSAHFLHIGRGTTSRNSRSRGLGWQMPDQPTQSSHAGRDAGPVTEVKRVCRYRTRKCLLLHNCRVGDYSPGTGQ